MEELFVTTTDNPYNYFTQFDDWFAFDTQKGYNTCAYVARIAMVSNEMSEAEYRQGVNDAAKEIVRLNLTGNYTLVENKPNNSNKNK